MTGIVQHKSYRIAWNQSRHSYLIDVGTRIGIPLVLVSRAAGSRILAPPHPETRYFEVEVDEIHANGQKTFVFQNIFPVRAGRKPDWYLMRFRIRRGGWSVMERFHFPTPDGESQWIYTDDFNILFLSSGGRHDLEMLLHLITIRLDEIAVSMISGTPLPSQFESQLACRDVFDSMFTDGVDGAFRDTILYRQHGEPIISPETGGDGALSGADICRNHGRITAQVDQESDLGVDLNQIEELNDLSWLCE